MTDTLAPSAETSAPQIFAGYIDEAEYCRQRGISLRTAQRDRQLRVSPPFTVVGKKVLYRIESVRAWLLNQEHQAERKPAAPRAGRRR